VPEDAVVGDAGLQFSLAVQGAPDEADLDGISAGQDVVARRVDLCERKIGADPALSFPDRIRKHGQRLCG